MQLSKKRSAYVLGLIFFVFLLAACGSTPDAAPPEPLATSGDTRLPTPSIHQTASKKAPLHVSFRGEVRPPSSAETIRYLWGIEDAASGSEGTHVVKRAGKNVNHVYQRPGTYNVTLTVSNNGGGKAQAAKSVTVPANPTKPVAYFTAYQSGSYCSRLKTEFTSFSYRQGADIVRQKWDFGDGSISQSRSKSVQHTYPSAGVYRVKLTVWDSEGGSSSAEMWQAIATNTNRSSTCPSDPGHP